MRPASLLARLRRYFHSGWAFLIPYLACYLLYAWRDWPVNSAGYSSIGASPPTSGKVPSLLQVYWAIHGMHVLLGIIAVASWWSRSAHHASGALRRTAFRLVTNVVPWLLLALVFAIPGAYLEWPSDPWEHLRRINEWGSVETVTVHSSWHKFTYFVAYSLLSSTAGAGQLVWLHLYNTGICLLLCWQYYLFSRACGLRRSGSMVFVIVQAVLFGNNIFPFYRYYGISSSVYAQLGAIALTRLILEWIACGTTLRPPALAGSTPARFEFWHAPTFFGYLLPGILCLSLLVAFSHPQGLGIAGLEIIAVIGWRLVAWKRTTAFWLAGTVAVLSLATVWWLPRHPAVDAVYRPQGWLSAWYGFDLFTTASPAFGRSLQILGVCGILNLLFGLWLVFRKNHIVGWLTLVPFFAMTLPCFALPIANLLASGTETVNIVAFHRLLLAVPPGLATVATLWIERHGDTDSNGREAGRPLRTATSVALVVLLLASGSFSRHRLWSTLQVTPEDLRLGRYIGVASTAAKPHAEVVRIDVPLASDVHEAFHGTRHHFISRQPFVILENRRLTQRVDWLVDMSQDRQWRLSSTRAPLSFSGIGGVHDAPTNIPHAILRPLTVGHRWLVFGGAPPERPSAGQLSNPPGQASEIFCSDLIPLTRGRRYRLTSTLRSEGNSKSLSYVAVAWYDSRGQLLPSNIPPPVGAGEPLGWNNGTYSYYGVHYRPSPSGAEIYSVTFGVGEAGEIPRQAKYLRVGALLNYRAATGARVSLADVVLVELPSPSRIVMDVPDFSQATTPGSVSAVLSRHWSPHHLAVDGAGALELNSALLSTVRR